MLQILIAIIWEEEFFLFLWSISPVVKDKGEEKDNLPKNKEKKDWECSLTIMNGPIVKLKKDYIKELL